MRSGFRLGTIGIVGLTLATTGCGNDKNNSPSAPASGSQQRHTITLINALPWDMGLVLDGSDVTVSLSGNTSTLGSIATGNHSWAIWEASTGDWYPTTNNGTLYIDRDYTLSFFDSGGYAAYSWQETARLSENSHHETETGRIDLPVAP